MSSPSVPEQLGRYRILSKLGEGGMGAVYLAEDIVLSRRVAVKVPRFSASEGRAVVERFQREARTAASIDHPNICAVYDFGEVNGLHYLVMPFIEGRPLSELIDEDNPWSPARAAALVRQLALAMEVLHQRGLIHRDLKPANVLLRANGDPVLMDFGLARSFTNQNQRMTQTGAALGTLPYMAPEQLLGEVKAIGPATDVYEMGVILYELLTGSLPFEGPPGVMCGQILHAQAELPSVRRPGLDASLDAVCLKALAKKPAERYASMTALAEALVPWACPVAVVSEPTIAALSVPPPPIEAPTEPRLSCPGCGKSLKVPASVAGKRLKCPRCQTVLGAAAAAVTQHDPSPQRAGRETSPSSDAKTAGAPPPQGARQRDSKEGRPPRLLWLLPVLLLLLAVALFVGLIGLSGGGDSHQGSGKGKKQSLAKPIAQEERPADEKPTHELAVKPPPKGAEGPQRGQPYTNKEPEKKPAPKTGPTTALQEFNSYSKWTGKVGGKDVTLEAKVGTEVVRIDLTWAGKPKQQYILLLEAAQVQTMTLADPVGKVATRLQFLGGGKCTATRREDAGGTSQCELKGQP